MGLGWDYSRREGLQALPHPAEVQGTPAVLGMGWGRCRWNPWKSSRPGASMGGSMSLATHLHVDSVSSRILIMIHLLL